MLYFFTKKLPRKGGKGFTLIELLVVVAIIMILAAVLMPRFLGYTDRARQARAVSDLGTMKTIVEVYTADEGQGVYPSVTVADANYVGKILQSKGVNFLDANTTGGIKDPWGFPYYYTKVADATSGTVSYILASPGKDGKFGTADDVFTTDAVQPTVGSIDTTKFADLAAQTIDPAKVAVSTK